MPRMSGAWLRYGHSQRAADSKGVNRQLDSFVPVNDVAGRHSVPVAAPADATFSAAGQMNPQQSVCAVFKTRP